MATSPETRSRLTREDLVGSLRKGCKPRDQWRIGTEHEKLGYDVRTHKRITWEQIAELLERVRARIGWDRIDEGGKIIGLAGEGASVTLEPGGQLELSGAPLATLWDTERELDAHLRLVCEIGREIGIDFIGLGLDPVTPNADVPRMPKGRYDFMARYMTEVGTRGQDMMFRSTTVQVNLDFESEADMVEKFRVSLALQPIVGALFSNSPFSEGRPAGWQSYRLRAWLDTDADRCGRLPFVFDEGFGFESYADWALDVPMYFVKRGHSYIPAAGATFRQFMEDSRAVRGLREGAPTSATIDDWELHLTTVFPDVRLKSFLEMRGADCGTQDMILALPALWVGLLYDADTQTAAWELVRGWSKDDLDHLSLEAPKLGLKTPFRGGTVLDVARRVVELARAGLVARGLGEEVFLAPLEEIARTGLTRSDHLLALFNGPWSGDIDKVYSPELSTWQPGAIPAANGHKSVAGKADGAART